VDIENTGVLDNGANYEASIDYAQIGLLDVGECLVDNIEVDYNGSNYVSNGTFEGGLGLTNWSLQGCMVRSSLENSGYQSSYSLHIRCSDKIWTGDNSCEVALNANSMAAGDTVTLRYKARWLRGWPEALLRLNGNWLEATAMPVPANLGTPGQPNSQRVTNAGPAMYNVTHSPAVPAAGQPVVVTAQCARSGWNPKPDALLPPGSGDQLHRRADERRRHQWRRRRGRRHLQRDHSGTAANQIVAFYIAAADSLGAATRFPALPNDNEPARECVVMFGDGNPGGSFGVYHLWITQTNVTRWANLGNLSRDWNNDCTFVDGTRVIYNMGGRFSGSPYHQILTLPTATRRAVTNSNLTMTTCIWARRILKNSSAGRNPGSTSASSGSQLAFTFVRALGSRGSTNAMWPSMSTATANGTLMEDTQVPNSDVVKEHFPNDDGGFLYKMQPWFEMAPFLSGYAMGFDNQSWCCLMPYTTTGGRQKGAALPLEL
jgi:hypothetical protein